jgi:hypothetical protein
MEGRSPRRKGRFRVQREFECSRIEQAMLAAAYERILPDDRLTFVEHIIDLGDHANNSQGTSRENTDSIPHYVSATGGQ